MPRQSLRRGSEPPEDESAVDVSPEAALFLNTTFSLHRISPLFVGREPLTPDRLGRLAARLRDTLVGDVVRGLEIGLDGGDSVMGRAGALEAVILEWVAVDAILDTANKGIQLSLQYENAVSTALLLPQQDEAAATSQFAHFPLLLLRMPAPLKTVVTDFLADTFDCRIGHLRLGTDDMVRAWESWVRDAGLPTKGPLAKDAVFTLGFHLPQPKAVAGGETNEESATEGLGIKAIDIIIPSQDLRRFLSAGRPLSRSDEGQQRPFFAAIAQYMEHHLALNLRHPSVRVTRIACGGFVLSEGRIKVFGLSDDSTDGDSRQRTAVRRLLGDLVSRSQGATPEGLSFGLG